MIGYRLFDSFFHETSGGYAVLEMLKGKAGKIDLVDRGAAGLLGHTCAFRLSGSKDVVTYLVAAT